MEADAAELIEAALASLDEARSRNPSYVYAATVREAIQRQQRVDHLHLSDVLVALRKAGYTVDGKTGLLNKPASARRLRSTASGAVASA